MAQWVKDLALSLQRPGLLLWCGSDPWLGSFHMPWAWQKKKKKSEELYVVILKAYTSFLMKYGNVCNVKYSNMRNPVDNV